MTDRPMTAILLALIVESAHWTKFRWEFNEEARDRAWQLTTVLIALAGVLIFLESTPYRALPNLLTWLPPLLLPMQFVQSFGLENSLPVNTFSFLARHRRKRNLRLGLAESLVHVNFGNVYFVTTMVAATLGSRASSWAFLPGITILTGWLLLARSRGRPLALVVALIVAGGLAVAGQLAIEKLEQLGGSASAGRLAFSPNGISTLVGKPGKVEQSPEIVWRLRPENSAPPRLLRTASYNDYQEGSWRLRPHSESPFKDLDTIEPVIGEIYHLLVEKTAFRTDMQRFNLRGAASNESPLPLPGDAASLRDFELDGVERNSLGTVRVFPKHSVIEGMVRWKGDANPEMPPFPREDLLIPKPERETLRSVVEQLRLAEQPALQDKLNVIREWFQRDFSYTRTLTISSSRQDSDAKDTKRPTAITRFLTEVKAGHCEYFAAATTLLMREAGIPARYTIGYAVMERDVKRGEFVIRGTHGHAWCRVWDASAGRWIDFDTTPANWLAALPPQTTAMQRFNDWLKRAREDFFLWRNRPKNRLAATLVMSAIGLGVIGFVIKKLWRSKRRMESEKQRISSYEGPISRTALNDLEHQAEKHLGPRPPGQPLAVWLMGLHALLADSSALDEALELHQRLRFDPAPPIQSERERLAQLAVELEAAIRQIFSSGKPNIPERS